MRSSHSYAKVATTAAGNSPKAQGKEIVENNETTTYDLLTLDANGNAFSYSRGYLTKADIKADITRRQEAPWGADKTYHIITKTQTVTYSH